MKYYQMHEQVYKDLQARGFISWDRKSDLDTLWSHQINESLKKFLNQQSIPFKNLKVLDLGTGAGTCALFCAKEGSQSIGVDISKTAIEMAKENNTKLALAAEFIEADILNLNLDKKFDLVTDSSLLHCLVGNADRAKFYEVVRSHLEESGYFFIHTMVESENMASLVENKYFRLQDEILYSLGIDAIDKGRVELDGKSYFPHRTVLKLDNLLSEIEHAGFQVICSEHAEKEGEPGTFIGLLKL